MLDTVCSYIRATNILSDIADIKRVKSGCVGGGVLVGISDGTRSIQPKSEGFGRSHSGNSVLRMYKYLVSPTSRGDGGAGAGDLDIPQSVTRTRSTPKSEGFGMSPSGNSVLRMYKYLVSPTSRTPVSNTQVYSPSVTTGNAADSKVYMAHVDSGSSTCSTTDTEKELLRELIDVDGELDLDNRETSEATGVNLGRNQRYVGVHGEDERAETHAHVGGRLRTGKHRPAPLLHVFQQPHVKADKDIQKTRLGSELASNTNVLGAIHIDDSVPWQRSNIEPGVDDSVVPESRRKDCHRGTTMHWAATVGNDTTVRLLLKIPSNMRMIRSKDQYSFTPLHRAAYNGHAQVALTLIQSGAWISARARRYNGTTPLHLAVCGGHENIARLLIKHGCNIYDEDDNGDTALHMAASRGLQSTVLLLLQKQANVDAYNDVGECPLHAAVANGGLCVMRTLIDHGADVSACDVSGSGNSHTYHIVGDTPIHTAVRAGMKKRVQLLIDRGANVVAIGKDGHTPVQVAKRLTDAKHASSDRQHIYDLLVSTGAGWPHSVVLEDINLCGQP